MYVHLCLMPERCLIDKPKLLILNWSMSDFLDLDRETASICINEALNKK